MASSDDSGDQLDRAGQSILRLIEKAADTADQHSRHAVDVAQKLSHELRAAEDRIANLEADLAASREQAERAEQWLDKIRSEIEERFRMRASLAAMICGAPTG